MINVNKEIDYIRDWTQVHDYPPSEKLIGILEDFQEMARQAALQAYKQGFEEGRKEVLQCQQK